MEIRFGHSGCWVAARRGAKRGSGVIGQLVKHGSKHGDSKLLLDLARLGGALYCTFSMFFF
ncbi:uncharacterized protein LY89DRAFT_679914 [Mollisia scopiformis]|uniref:Uncharacterized protein n=1 Tax=Mollisia scopiformis TaxID=149040 RepID=A0A194XSD4_MOLSC|nr:uncharacterized protein LY89DRAFT_679914 [Mollisia scopiformis]KUJ23108.1 hypothetical protein LY89DRAFT_679914 [Mollisia scopiformis]